MSRRAEEGKRRSGIRIDDPDRGGCLRTQEPSAPRLVFPAPFGLDRRTPQHVDQSAPTHAVAKRDLLPPAIALVLRFLPAVAMAHIPWNPADGMASRFELALLPITAELLVRLSLGVVRRRFWAVPILLLAS